MARPPVPALLLVVVLGACSSPGPRWRSREGGGAGAAGARAASVEFRSAAAPAPRYNDPPLLPAPATPLVDEVTRAVAETAEANGLAAPTPDGRLCAVAEEVAALVTGDAPPPFAAVEFALAQHGIIEPSPHLVVMHDAGKDVAAVGRTLRERLPRLLGASRFARVGVGAGPGADGQGAVVLALLESFVETQPFPRELGHDASASLRARLLHPYAEPEVYVTGGDGTVARLDLVLDRGQEGAFRAQISCGPRDGKRQVEIVGHDRYGAAVLANFPVYCGEPAPRSLVVALPSADEAPVTDAAAAARQIFALANEDRKQAGLPPLVWDELAARTARAHSEEMREKQYVGHISPTTGSAGDRARRAGIRTPLVLENLARAYSPVEAETGLMNSPGHRANLLSPDATHLGVGVALGNPVAGRPEIYVTQLFFRVPPPLDPAKARDVARKAVQKRRLAARLAALSKDGELEGIAQELAASLASGDVSRERAQQRADQAIAGLGNRFSAVLTVMTVLGDPEQAGLDSVADGSLGHFGLGLAQGSDPNLGDGAIYVVILLAKAR